MQRSLILFISFITIFISPAILFSQPAFPGAEGFGANSMGGRGGMVYIVTNLNDDGPGSLRAAVEARGPRIAVFEISGTIALKSVLKVRNPYLTIAGQTAPGGGICLKDNELDIATDHVIVRYIRSRAGDNVSNENHGFSITSGKNIIIDHCSASWAVDETIDIWNTRIQDHADSITVQWCFITESLHNSAHWKGPHGKGSLIVGSGGSKYTFHHNLYAHHDDRNPGAGNYNWPDVDKVGLIYDFRNNVIYNWGKSPAGTAEGNLGKTQMNFVNNYYKIGRDTQGKYIWFAEIKECGAYFNSNCMNGVYPEDPWSLVLFRRNFTAEEKAASDFPMKELHTFTDDKDISLFKLSSPVQAAPVKTDDATTAYERVLVSGGATLPQRDVVDARIVNDVINSSGRIIDDEAEVGGWPELKSTPPPNDSDRDGMPDYYEIPNKLNPKDPSDAKGTNLSTEGYTNIEVYLNSLVANNIVGSKYNRR
jgi:pectate lyase